MFVKELSVNEHTRLDYGAAAFVCVCLLLVRCARRQGVAAGLNDSADGGAWLRCRRVIVSPKREAQPGKRGPINGPMLIMSFPWLHLFIESRKFGFTPPLAPPRLSPLPSSDLSLASNWY